MRVANGHLPILATKFPQNTALMRALDLFGREKLRISGIFSNVVP